MSKRSVPRAKLAKKTKKKLDSERRVTWSFSPVSRIKESKKVYRRSKCKPRQDELD